MARARNIKPKFFQNDDLGELSPLARLLFIGLWTIADFNGCLEYRAKRIKVQILPYDECSVEELAISLDKSGFISIYSVQGQLYIKILKFQKHQTPHKNERDAGSEIPDISLKDNEINELKEDGINPDKNGTTRAESLFPLPSSLNLNPVSGFTDSRIQINTLVDQNQIDPIPEIFSFWQKTMNSPRSVFDEKRRKLIKAALKNYSPADICKAIRGCSKSAYHMGDNKGKTIYNQLGLILRSAEYIDKFIAIDDNPDAHGHETDEQRSARIEAEFCGLNDTNTIDMET